MKRIIIALSIICNIALAQNKSCCMLSVSNKNSILAMNTGFANKHINPIPYNSNKLNGEMISFEVANGKKGNAYSVQPGKGSKNVLIIFHEWWGLNDYIKEQADEISAKLADQDLEVIAIDLFDGQVADNRESAAKYMNNLQKERAEAIINGLVKHIGPDKNYATLGWCLGGAWSLQAALLLQKKAVACVMYYGMPETDIKKLQKLNCDVLGIFANEDEYINRDIVQQFEENMHKATKKLKLETYNADHAFANPSNPKNNKEYAEDAMQKTIAFLKSKYTK